MKSSCSIGRCVEGQGLSFGKEEEEVCEKKSDQERRSRFW